MSPICPHVTGSTGLHGTSSRFNSDLTILLKLKIYTEIIVENGRNCSLGAISPLIHNILLPDVGILRLKKDQIFSSI